MISFLLLLFFRDLPRALMIGIPLVTIVYILTNIGYIAVVGKDGILESGAVALVSFFLIIVSLTALYSVGKNNNYCKRLPLHCILS